MSQRQHIWVRAETRPDEERVAITPDDAASLIGAGHQVSVESCPKRVLPVAAYGAKGCRIVPQGTWRNAPRDAWILGLKELPEDTGPLRHRHIYFAHAFKEQSGAASVLRRFANGAGQLFDLEYMTDAQGRRVAAFGYWAGYLGAALGLLEWTKGLGPLITMTQSDLKAQLATIDPARHPRKALVIGAKGRCGHGARDALAHAGVIATEWDIKETRALDKAALLDHDLLVNAVGMTGPATPFLTPKDVNLPQRRLQLIVDVTCDVGGPAHCLPVYDRLTSWAQPVLRLPLATGAPLRVIAIDNLPSLLPAESSADFSGQLTPHLMTPSQTMPWQTAQSAFQNAMATMASTSLFQKEETHA